MKRICVFCGSNTGGDAAYARAARTLGRELAKRELALVYGGASVGLMGALANSALEAGGEVIGVIPEALHVKEVVHTGLSELHVLGSMHERKAMMNELSDGFIALPGGWGTLEELFETLTWAQLGLHRNPCGIINVKGYFDGIVRYVDHAVDQRFVKPAHRSMLMVESEPAALLERFQSYRAPRVRKWISRHET